MEKVCLDQMIAFVCLDLSFLFFFFQNLLMHKNTEHKNRSTRILRPLALVRALLEDFS